MQSFDVVVHGGGMIGLAVACGLQGSGLKVAVIEQSPVPVYAAEGNALLRVSAINEGSRRLLEHLQVWPLIAARRISAYHAMDVWEQDSFGKITFDDNVTGMDGLGYIVENDLICWALWQHASQCDDITLFANTALTQVAFGAKEAFITLNNGNMLTASLLVAADGAHSWLREQAHIPLTFWDYQHHALVATVRTEEPHNAVARQLFHHDGILAFLPLQQPNLSSIVWSLPPVEASRYLAMQPPLFEQQLAITFDTRLGLCHLASERQVFPLTARYARNFAAHRLALVGDAAHTIHPLAGQGANLGFMDASTLVRELRRIHTQRRDIGLHISLRRYERERKLNAALMLAAMQGLKTLFSGSHPVKKWIRSLGLTLADKLPGVKPLLVRQAMGLNDNIQ